MFVKIILTILGTISLVLGIIGIVVPGLPTTPFLLLTAGLYLKSSNKLYNKLISNKYAGPYILNYKKNKGMLKKEKLSAIIFIALMISISSIFFISDLIIKLIVITAGIIGTLTIWFIVPRGKKQD